MRTAVDTSVLLDVLGADQEHGERSREALRTAYRAGALLACDVVWGEVRAHFPEDEAFRDVLGAWGYPSTRSRPRAPRSPVASGARTGPDAAFCARGWWRTSWWAHMRGCRRMRSSPGTVASTANASPGCA